MSDASHMKINVGAGNSGKKFVLKQQLTYEKLVKWIKSKNHDEEITAKLIKIASTFPEKTYHIFKKNYPKYLEQIVKNIH